MNHFHQANSKVAIKVVPTAGFCFGVKRAYQRALDTIATNPGAFIAMIGPLIHNPQVVKQLEDEGVRVVENLDDINNGILIVRSHGLSPCVIREAERRGLTIVDATCPYVKKLQKDAIRLADEGYFIVLVGEREHPEIRAVISDLPGGFLVIKDITELQKHKLPDKIAFLAQTTQNIENFQQIILHGVRCSHEVRVFNTICDATNTRQRMTQELAKEVDLMVIVGGRNSANTNRLLHLSCGIQPRTYLIEVADEFKASWVTDDVEAIGVSAGASTPGWIIDEVVEKIRRMTEN